jgi:hypothetical protein
MELRVLQRGSCEPLKAGVHAAALGLFAIMGLYNAAAWLSRRQRHLAVNAILYSTLTLWEQKHVARHLEECRKCPEERTPSGAAGADRRHADVTMPARFAA